MSTLFSPNVLHILHCLQKSNLARPKVTLLWTFCLEFKSPTQTLLFHHMAGNTTRSLCHLSMIQLTVTPASALADEPVHIRATGLPPLQMVTLTASLRDEKGNLFQSKAFYRSDEAGELDLKQAPSVGGDYVGVHPMGLFWSLKPERTFGRLLKRDVMNSPFLVTLNLYDSVCFQDSATVKPRASQVVQRWYLRPGTQRVQIREGRVRGALFLPPGETHGWW